MIRGVIGVALVIGTTLAPIAEAGAVNLMDDDAHDEELAQALLLSQQDGDGDGEDVPVGEQPGSPNDSRSEDDDDPLSDKPLRRAPKKVAIACDFCRGT